MQHNLNRLAACAAKEVHRRCDQRSSTLFPDDIAAARRLVSVAMATFVGIAATVNGADMLSVKPAVHGVSTLSFVRSFYQNADDGDATLNDNAVWSQAQVLKPTTVRGINIEQNWPDHGSSALDANGNFAPSNRLTDFLEVCKTRGLRPHVVCGQIVPSHIGGASAIGWTQSKWDAYARYAEAFVRYVAAQYNGTGFPWVMFEIGNETDASSPGDGAAWFMPDLNFTLGSIESYNGYYRIYKIWAAAVDKVAKESPLKELIVAGPAATTYTFKYGTMQSVNHMTWMEKLAQDCARDKVRLDVITYHDYAARFTADNLPAGDQTLSERSFIVRNGIAGAGQTAAKISVTEWGPHYDVTNTINCNEVGAAWTAAFLIQTPSTALDAGAFLLYSDIVDDKLWWTWPSMLHGIYRKGIFNVFDAFSRLPGTTCSFDKSAGWATDLKVIASSDDSTVGVLVANFGGLDNGGNPRDIVVKILGVKGPSARVAEYVIDKDHSNVWTQLINRGLPATQKPLEKVQDFTVTVSEGTVSLPVRTLAKSAVYLWMVTGSGFTEPSTATLSAGLPPVRDRRGAVVRSLDARAAAYCPGQIVTAGGRIIAQSSCRLPGNGIYFDKNRNGASRNGLTMLLLE